MKAKDRWLRASQVGIWLNLNDTQVYDLAGAGEFITMRVGIRGIRILESSVDDFIKRRVNLFILESGLILSEESEESLKTS